MNKESEKEILNMVFSEKEYSIIPDEEPDFILTSKQYKYKFGVEITEAYKDEALARLLHRKDYIDLIIDPKNNKNKGKINKGDEKKLPVREITVLNDDDSFGDTFKGIVFEPRTPNEIGNTLLECIKKKEDKLKKYKMKANQNYLIIYDMEGFLYGESSEKIYRHIANKSLFKMLTQSKFKEIYVITESTDTKTYSGLIALHFINSFSNALSFANRNEVSNEYKLDCALNILYNLGFRFKWCFCSNEDAYYIMYHDCLVKFVRVLESRYCIKGRIEGLPKGLDLNQLELPWEVYEGRYNDFLKIYDEYKKFINENEVRHYIYSKPISK